MKKKLMLNILLENRYTKSEALKAMKTIGFDILTENDFSDICKVFDTTLENVKNQDCIGLSFVEYKNKGYVIINPA